MVVQIELTKDEWAIVDDCDSDLSAVSWYTHANSDTQKYAARKPGKNPVVFLHRTVLERKLGRTLAADERCEVVNNNGLDCRRENVILSVGGLYQRMTKRRATNKTGYTGVTYHKREKRFRAQISVDGKCVVLGWRDTAEEAAALYEAAKRRYTADGGTGGQGA